MNKLFEFISFFTYIQIVLVWFKSEFSILSFIHLFIYSFIHFNLFSINYSIWIIRGVFMDLFIWLFDGFLWIPLDLSWRIVISSFSQDSFEISPNLPRNVIYWIKQHAYRITKPLDIYYEASDISHVSHHHQYMYFRRIRISNANMGKNIPRKLQAYNIRMVFIVRSELFHCSIQKTFEYSWSFKIFRFREQSKIEFNTVNIW
jgi:hypothetical protein